MQRSHPGRVALTSSLALLLGAGVPVQQIAAQERAADAMARHPFPVQSQGFEMVPGPAPKDVLPKPTAETPGANGFELLPPNAESAATQASASVGRAPADGLVDGPSGFQMLPPTETAVALSSPQPLGLLAEAAPGGAVQSGLPTVQADAQPGARIENGFKVLAAAPGRALASGFAAAPSAGSAIIPAALSQAAPAASAMMGAARRLMAAPSLVLKKRSTVFAAPVGLASVNSFQPDVVLVSPATPQTPLALAQASAPTLAGAPSLASVNAATPEAELILVNAPEAPASPAAEPVSLTRTGFEIAPPAQLGPELEPALAGLSHISAPSAEILPQQPAPQPILIGLSEPVDLASEIVPAIERPAARRRLRRRLPTASLVLAKAAPRARLRLAGASPLFLESPERPIDTGFRLTPVAASVPPAQLDSEPATAESAAPAPRLQLASYEAPVATTPALLQLDASAAELTLVSPSREAAASAETVAQPASAVAEQAPPSAQTQAPPVIHLAQADAPPAPQAASAPPPAPEAAPAAPPQAAPAPAPATAATAPAAAPPAAPVVAAPTVVQRIVVQGNERIESSTILSYLPIQVGDAVDSAKIDLAVKTLFRTGLFADDSMEMQGSDLVVRVSENPIINQVVFEGNHALKEDKLRDEVQVRPRGIFTRSKVEQDAQKIIELYRRSGRISATVTPKIVQLPQKRVDLIFEINEGPKSGIVHINFVGNKSFGDNALRDVIVTRESHWYKFFSSSDNYDPDRIEYDREQLRKFYRNHGFYDFRIVSGVAELAPDKNGFVVTFTVEEGPKYHFGKLKVTTELKRLNGELLQALLPIRQGELYEDDRIEKATDALTYAAGANGFAFVDVRPRYVAHPETRTVDVDFDIKEGPRVYIERIDVVGNTRTLDYVIRRELRVAEGDAYNRVLVDRSKQQVKALGFFKDVDIDQLPGSSPDKTILRVKVTEQPTGQLSFSIGYSSLEKLVGDVGISESNFRGRGQKVDFEVSLGYLQKRVMLSFTEPRFLGRNMAAGVDLYTYNYNYQTTAAFSSSSQGVTLRTGFPINQYTSVGFNYAIHTDQVSLPTYVLDPATGACSSGYSQTLCDEVGRTFTSSVGYKVRIDRRNDYQIPTRGFYIDLNQDFAGLGGVKYIKTTADAAWFYGFAPAWILSLKGQAGYITGWGGDSVRINDRFFRGGDDFRGFQIAGVGPRDTTLQSQGCVSGGTSTASSNGTCYGDALGAKAFAIGTLELQFPNLIPAQYGIKTALFTDFGTAGIVDSNSKRNPNGTVNPFIKDDMAFRASVGISVLWKSPMGPLKFDFSKVLKKAPYDVPETFYFSTATSFQ